MGYLLVVACAVALGFLIFRKKTKKPPHDTYVCDVCNERECICRKEDRP